MKRVSNRGDESSRGKYGSIIKIFKTSRGRMIFETAALLAFCVALLISGSVSLAWFSFNNVSSEIGKVKIKNPYFSVDYKVHPVISISGNTYSFGDFENGVDPHLPEYDRYGLNYNGSDDSDYAVVLEFSFNSDNDQMISIETTANGGWETGINNFLSNGIEITGAVVSDSNAVITSDPWQSFVSMSKDSENKVTGLNGTKKTTLGKKSYSVNESNNKKLWFVMRYNKDAVDYISSLNVKEIASGSYGSQLSNDSVQFRSDIIFMIDGGSN